MTKLPKAARATLKALWREFRRCSNRYPPLYHEVMIHDLGPEPFSYTDFVQWDLDRRAGIPTPFPKGGDGPPYDSVEGCKSFRKAFADKFSGWDAWDVFDERSFGRFSGSPDGIEEFKRIAASAYLMVFEMDIIPWASDPAFDDGDALIEWMSLLHRRAQQYPTPLLRSESHVWGVTDDEKVSDEMLKAVGTPEDGGAPYPLHPRHRRLVHSVFTSSMSAIEQILDDEVGFLLGDDSIPDGGLVEEPGETQRTEEKVQAEPTVEVAIPDDGIKPPVLEFDFSVEFQVWRMKFDTGDGIESYGEFPNWAGIRLLKKLLSHPDKRWSLEDLGVDVSKLGKIGKQPKSDRETIKAVQEKIEQDKEQIRYAVEPKIKSELENEVEELEKYLASVVTKRGEQRAWLSNSGTVLSGFGVQLTHARQRIEMYMPKFAEYLRKTTGQRRGFLGYWPQ